MKSSLDQLAAFGGPPCFQEPVHVGQPNLPSLTSLIQRVEQTLRSGYLTNNGPRVRELEAVVADLAGTRCAVAICNATTALQILARALDLTGEVIMPAFTFIATAHAMEWIGLRPVFADIDPETQTLDPRSVARLVTDKTSAILGVHVWGHLCDVPSLRRIAEAHRIRLIFDACHAMGCSSRGRTAGSFGDAEVFSLHATKLVHSLEGGVITTNNVALADRCRRLRNFGITGLTEISDIGINGKMHEVSAAVGLHLLEQLPSIIATNLRNRRFWEDAVSRISGIRLVEPPPEQTTNGQYVVCVLNAEEFGISRDRLVSLLRAEGMFARSYFMPGCHRAEPYVRREANEKTDLSTTNQLLSYVLQLPTGLAVTPSMIHSAGHLLQFLHQNASEISRRIDEGQPLSLHPSDPANTGSASAGNSTTQTRIPGGVVHEPHDLRGPMPHHWKTTLDKLTEADHEFAAD